MQAATSLTLKSALLPWIEMQILQSSTKAEGVEWIKILENIIIIVDANKIEASTNGEWRVIICRCLGYLIDDKSCCKCLRDTLRADANVLIATTVQNFPHAVPIILRLSSLAGPALSELPALLDLAVQCLEMFEQSIKVEDDSEIVRGNHSQGLPYPPHRSLDIHQRWSNTMSSVSDVRNLASELLEMLWKASMSLTRKCDAWDKLTPRLLLLNSRRHRECSREVDVAEWARKEVVQSFRM